ncbi:MAG TPA: hypothetical protein PKC22_16190 [Rhodocyclaceae bacterium]|nr:hypothetical protein [Rhodocyclaceae bacterium]
MYIFMTRLPARSKKDQPGLVTDRSCHSRLQGNVAKLEAGIQAGIARLEARTRAGIAGLEARIAETRGDPGKWTPAALTARTALLLGASKLS